MNFKYKIESKNKSGKNTHNLVKTFYQFPISFWIKLKCFTKLYTIKPFDLSSYCPIPSFTATLASLLCFECVRNVNPPPPPISTGSLHLLFPLCLNSFLQKSRAITFSPTSCLYSNISLSVRSSLTSLLEVAVVTLGTSLVVQWLSFCACNIGALGLIPGQGTRSHMPQLKTLHAAMKIKDPARPN